MNVANGKCIRNLGTKSMRAAKTRNLIAVFAIALTSVLFTTLFTVAMSINHSFQQANFRQAGGFSHGSFKYLTEAQFDELKGDPRIKQYGLRRFIGSPVGEQFSKAHVEVGYSDDADAHWMFCDPAEGRLPAEGTNEAATDTRVLELLGIEPEPGSEFTLTIDVDGTELTETFTLSGWWEYDEAVVASHVLLPHSRAQEILDESGLYENISADGLTGSWNLGVMLKNSLSIEGEMNEILTAHGFQNESRTEEGYIPIGVNWGYSGAQLADSADPGTIAAIAGLLLLIIFTGYLIIYNVFQISVSNDIRFYGLLKTIGTTGRQIRGIIRRQALTLSLLGIPLGLVAGYAVGLILTPMVLSQLNGVVQDEVSSSWLIFLGSAAFSLITVLISCRRPGRAAGRVSPIEALRYTEASASKKTRRRSRSGASLPRMARANLGRSRGKTAVTVVSLSLAVLLLNLTVTFTRGFDMDKYLNKMASDFIVADADYFQVDALWDGSKALPEEVVSRMEGSEGFEAGGRVYGKTSYIEQFISEEYYRLKNSRWADAEGLDSAVAFIEKNKDGLLSDSIQLYGMEDFALGKLNLMEGDLSKLGTPGGNYIAAVYGQDDYGNPEMDSHWAKLGDTVTLRYVTEYEYYDPDTGDTLDPEKVTGDQPFRTRAKTYEDIDYEVAAIVSVPHSLSYRYYGTDEFIMDGETFRRDTGTSAVMYYACDVSDGKEGEMESFLNGFTNNEMPRLNYESKASYAQEFESFRSMFLMLGGVLSFIVGLVGVLNFLNAVLTGIYSRRRELSMLQAIGMTGRQLKSMLIWEGLYYALGASCLALSLTLLFSPMLSNVLSGIFWFFTYRFTVSPILLTAPVFALFGIALPLLVYRRVSRQSIVERLRIEE